MNKQLLILSAAVATLVFVGLVSLTTPVSADDSASEMTETNTVESGIVAFYFHGNLRCKTCKTLEAYSTEAITKGFAKELQSGQLHWRTVNTDHKENKHFLKDFELTAKSVVLAEYSDGKIVRFKNLKLVWQLVGDKDGFLTYVREATRDFLQEA